MLSLSNVVLILAISHGILLSIIILLKSKKFYPNFLLFLFITSCNIILINLLYTDLKLEMLFPYIPLVLDGAVYLPGPLFFLYVCSILNKERKIKKVDLLHFLLFFIYIAFTIPDYFKPERAVVKSFLSIYSAHPPFASILFNWTIIAQILIYLLVSLKEVGKYHRRIRGYYSSVSNIQTTWIRGVIYLFLIGLSIFLFVKICLCPLA
ncbi:MAG: hypothetical protein DRP92_02180 [Candidatus Neomarinimicrobiota bacterium]|nr:hypothetical protein [Candidatus Neomarinimicrobiota bacterium]RKY54019.1 MAG: hypothetical protein DRP92_02180 [Candidatus Neomarinimicrobiota bacterium]